MSEGAGATVGALADGDPVVVGAYRIEGLIGRGGQASVYLGRTAGGDAVAVKVFDDAWLADPQGRAQVRAEIAALQGIAAFGTARLIDAAPDADPAYLVSEYVPGPNLEEAVRSRGPLRGADLDRFALATLTALRSVHAGELVHRDLKPSNVVLGPDGPRLVDFGIVSRSGAIQDATDGVLGTRHYLAPELLDGGAVGPSSDMFGWAATTVFAASGRPPTGPDDPLPELAPALAAVLHRCLDADPARRPDAAQAMDLVLEAAHQSRDQSRQLSFEPSLEPSSEPVARPIPAWGTPPEVSPVYAAPSVPAALSAEHVDVKPWAPVPATPWGPVPVRPAQRLVPRRRRLPKWVMAPVAGVVLLTMSHTFAGNGGQGDTTDPGHVFPVAVDPAGRGFAAPDYPPYSSVLPRRDEQSGTLVVPADDQVVSAGQTDPAVHVDPVAVREPMSIAADGSTVTVQSGCDLGTWGAAPTTNTPTRVAHQAIPAMGGQCAASLSPGGRYLVTLGAGADDTTVLTVADQSSTVTAWSKTFGGSVVRVEFSANGRRVAFGLRDGSIRVWDLVGHREVGSVAPDHVSVDTHDWAVDAGLSTIAGSNVDDDAQVSFWGGAPRTTTAANPSANSSADAAAGDPAAGDPAAGSSAIGDPLQVEAWSGRQLALNADSSRLAVVRPDGSIGMWSVSDRTPVAAFAGGSDEGAFDAVAFSPDGHYLAAAGQVGARLWDLRTGAPVGPRLAAGDAFGSDSVVDLRFSAKGTQLFARGQGGEVVVWRLTDTRPR